MEIAPKNNGARAFIHADFIWVIGLHLDIVYGSDELDWSTNECSWNLNRY